MKFINKDTKELIDIDWDYILDKAKEKRDNYSRNKKNFGGYPTNPRKGQM